MRSTLRSVSFSPCDYAADGRVAAAVAFFVRQAGVTRVTSLPFPEADAGLCATCTHARVVKGARSLFVRCARSDSEARFPRYPPLPVDECDGYDPAATGPKPN